MSSIVALCFKKKKVSVQAPFRHRYRFKSIGLAPVSEKTQTIPIPTNDDTSSDATSQSAVTSFISPPDTQKAEVLWVLHTVTRHNSFKSNDDIRGVFAAMFPDSQLAKSFTCGEKKTAYVAKYGIASFIKKELSCSVSEKPYVVMFDESMNKTTKSKQMDLHLRFWTTDDEFGMLQNNGPLYSLVSLMKSCDNITV